MTDADPWGELVLPPEEPKTIELGTLRLGIRRAAQELWVQPRRAPEVVDLDGGPWQRWAVGNASGIHVRPAMPDRMLIVSTEHSYHLAPGAESRFYVRIPLFVQVVVSTEKGDVVVADVPSMVLSDTWWGAFWEGELAYWLKTTARIEVNDDLFVPHMGMCPVRLMNESPEALPLDHFAVRAAHLTLFSEGERSYWTDEVRVRYEGAPEGSAIRFQGKAPSEAPDARLIAPPRMPSQRGFRARTFDRLRSFSNLEF